MNQIKMFIDQYCNKDKSIQKHYYLGTQETLRKPILLYNCEKCENTIVYGEKIRW